jgi:serine O-acetyltransferase
MSPFSFSQILTDTVDELSSSVSLKGLFHEHRDGDALPSGTVLREIIELSRAILFPGFYGNSTVCTRTIHYHIGVNIERLYGLLAEQLLAGLCFAAEDRDAQTQRSEEYLRHEVSAFRMQANQMAAEFVQRLPALRKILATDVEAAYNGDPAAESFGEVISCYPVIKALSNYRVAHELLLLGAPLIPRIITEMAHSETGIDIHPGAHIGHHFTIDHGTGVVIGATCIIGNNVKLYQGVTLGAKSFPLDDEGNPIKGIPRHPILEDDVIVYSNATILGRITIGKGATIGGNIWVTEDVPPGARIVQRR